jgi:carbon-monoxide dehydrogenase small subunit
MKYSLRVNESTRDVDVPPMKRLLDVLREDIGLTGSKEGCGEGECGACTITLDGAPVLSCLVPVCQAAGVSIGTVEGLASGSRLAPVQDAFLEGAAQCGICTPGILVTAAALIHSRRELLTEDDVRDAIAGNLCRCTGYVKIVEAILRADAEAKA